MHDTFQYFFSSNFSDVKNIIMNCRADSGIFTMKLVQGHDGDNTLCFEPVSHSNHPFSSFLYFFVQLITHTSHIQVMQLNFLLLKTSSFFMFFVRLIFFSLSQVFIFFYSYILLRFYTNITCFFLFYFKLTVIFM